MAEISVIIPVYNAEKYLDRCMESILSQTFRNFEIILVNDGSKDNSAAICDGYVKRYTNIHVIHQSNGGAANARNNGIEWVRKNSESQWIHFVDADDWIHCRLLEILYQSCHKDKTCISVCNFERVCQYHSADNLSVDTVKKAVYNVPDFLNEKSSLCFVVWGKLYHIDLFENLRFPDGKLYEDVFLMYKLIYKAEKIIFIDYPLYFYFDNPDSSMNSSYSLRKLDEVEAGEEQVVFFKEKNDEKNLIQAYKRLMYYYDSHMRKLKDFQGGRPYYQKLKKKLAKLLLHKAKLCGVSLQKNSAYYESAFPVFMNIYWKIRKLKSLLSK